MNDKNKTTKKVQKPLKSSYNALLFNNNEFVKRIKLDISKNYFTYDGKSYNINFENTLKFNIKIISIWDIFSFRNNYFIVYDINNPEPLYYENKNIVPKYLGTDVYNSIIETKVISQANNHQKGSMFGNLDIKKIIIIFAIVGIGLYFLMNGGIK